MINLLLVPGIITVLSKKCRDAKFNSKRAAADMAWAAVATGREGTWWAAARRRSVVTVATR
jgi:hypothetical protein